MICFNPPNVFDAIKNRPLNAAKEALAFRKFAAISDMIGRYGALEKAIAARPERLAWEAAVANSPVMKISAFLESGAALAVKGTKAL
jgi:hypothetical protein